MYNSFVICIVYFVLRKSVFGAPCAVRRTQYRFQYEGYYAFVGFIKQRRIKG